VDDAGKVVYEVTEQAAKNLPDWVQAGRAVKKINTLDDIIREGGEQVPKQLRRLHTDIKSIEASGFKGVLTDVPKTAAERIRQGYSGAQFQKPFMGPGTTLLPETQSAVVGKVSEIAERIGKIDSPIVRGIKETFRGPVHKELRRAIPGQFGEEASDLYLDAKRVERGQLGGSIVNDAEFDADLIAGSVARKRNAEFRSKGYADLDSYMDSLTGKFADPRTGTTRQEQELLNILYKYPEQADEIRKTGQFRYRGFNLRPDTEAGVSTFSKVVDVDPRMMDELGEATEHAQKMGRGKNVLQEQYIATPDLLGIQRQAQHHYAKQLVNQADRAQAVQKFTKSSNELQALGRVISAKRRSWRGATVEAIERMRAKAKYIAKEGGFDDAEKVVAHMIHDEKLIGDHTIGDIIRFAEKTELPKNIRVKDDMLEMLESAHELKDVVNRLRLDRGFGNELLDKVLKTNVGDLFSKATDPTIQDLYVKSLPAVDAFSKAEVTKTLAWDRFMKKVFLDGMDEGVSTIGSVAEKAKLKVAGFTVLDDLPYARMHHDRARELLGRHGLPFDPNDTYFWALKNEVYDALKKSPAFKILGEDSSLKKGILRQGIELFDDLQRTWKETTLFTIPGYFIRNLFDDLIRVGAEGTSARHLADAAGVLAREGDYDWFGKLIRKGKKKTFPTLGGRRLTEREVWDIAIKGDLFTGIGEFGEFGNADAMFDLLRKRGVLTGSGKDAADLAGQAKKWYQRMPERYKRYMDRAMKLQAHLEAETSMALLLRKLETLPVDEAVKQTKLAKIDYSDLNSFERRFLKRLFPFYSFKKGISKYLLWKYAKNPAMIKGFTKLPDVIEDTIIDPEQRYNKMLLPEWLNTASIQVTEGAPDAEGKTEPIILNLKGLTSLAELADLAHPFKATLGMLSPFIKIPAERMAGRDFYFQRPLERYENEKTTVAGLPINRRNPLAAFAKSLRLPKTVVDVTEAALKETPYSVFGTQEKESFFGIGALDPGRRPETFGRLFAKRVIGAPVTHLDTDRAQAALVHEISDHQNDYRKAMRAIARRYAEHDPEAYKRMADRRTRDYMKIITKYSRPGTFDIFRGRE
jgi:hypothetical protein